MRALVLASLLALMAGCGTDVSLVPRTNDVGGSRDKLILTEGVASLVAATDGGNDTLDSSSTVTLTADNPNVVGILDGENANEFVLVGASVGSTTIHIDLDGDPNRDQPVDVVSP